MRILMTSQAIRLLGAMRLPVAGSTLRHDSIIIVLARVIRMEHFMTLLTGEPVFAAGLSQVCKLSDVALATINRLQWGRHHFIQAGIYLGQCTFNSNSVPWLEHSSQGDDSNEYNFVY